MLQEFRAFIARGNALDLAVAVIIGAAFATIVGSLTDDLIMPVVGAVFGGVDFSNHYVVLSGAAEPGMSLEAARASGANVLAWGNFVSTVINFLVLAFVIFPARPPGEQADEAGRRDPRRFGCGRVAHRDSRSTEGRKRAESALNCSIRLFGGWMKRFIDTG